MSLNKFISLISSGFDSPLAAALMINRDFTPIFITFLTSDDERHSMKKKVVTLIKKFKNVTDRALKVYIIDYD
ncbi:MAG: hypothetical protein P8Y23_11700, partial [Candidatus Lokiarchaeota archaeon]